MAASSRLAAMASPQAYLGSCFAVGTALSLGDSCTQFIERTYAPAEGLVPKPWSLRRTAEFATMGVCVLAPASHTLELLLERFMPGTGGMAIAQKVGSRVMVSPLFLSLNFGTLALMRGQDVRAELSAKVLPAWQVGALFWPGVAALTYKFVPLLARPATGAAVGVVWGSFLSWMAHNKAAPGVAPPKDAPSDVRAEARD
jgi:hypothetical protein